MLSPSRPWSYPDYHTCGVRPAGAASCWGTNTFAQTVVPTGSYRQISAGGVHTCAVRSDDSLVCFGRNDDGQTVVPPDGQ